MGESKRLWRAVIVACLPLVLLACVGGAFALRSAKKQGFARFNANEIVQTFRGYGLKAVDPIEVTASYDTYIRYYRSAPIGSGEVYKFLQSETGANTRSAEGYLLVFGNTADMETMWSYLSANLPKGLITEAKIYRNANVILLFFYARDLPPDISSYVSAFIGLR